MRRSSTLLLGAAAFWQAAFAAPHPQPSPSIPMGLCTRPGELICITDTTFAICDAQLGGVEQPLAKGDNRCLGKAIPQVIPVQVIPVKAVPLKLTTVH